MSEAGHLDHDALSHVALQLSFWCSQLQHVSESTQDRKGLACLRSYGNTG